VRPHALRLDRAGHLYLERCGSPEERGMNGHGPQLIEIVENGFSQPNVLVVGDLMLDKYVWGDVERISPEAPVPVLRTARHTEQPGGAANVAMNLAGLGARVTVMGFAGGDHDHERLETLLGEAGVKSCAVACPAVPTTSKLRVLAGHQQLLRMDCDSKPGDFNGAADTLLNMVTENLSSASVVVLSDYAKGVLSERVCRTIIEEARRLHVPVVVDPKGRDFTRYRGATTICPNARELAAVTGESASDLKWLLAAGQAMVASLNLQYMLVTLSEKGIAILRQDSHAQIPCGAASVRRLRRWRHGRGSGGGSDRGEGAHRASSQPGERGGGHRDRQGGYGTHPARGTTGGACAGVPVLLGRKGLKVRWIVGADRRLALIRVADRVYQRLFRRLAPWPYYVAGTSPAHG
jgi:rfaE bifunctional protein kinase chain/domain